MNIRWNQIAAAVAAGVLMGALFSDYYHMHLKRRPPQPVPTEGAIEKFTRELGLSGPQQEQVSAIFNKYRPEVKKTKDSIQPRLEELRRGIKSEVRSVLTPEQYARLEELDNDSKRRENRPPPPRDGEDPDRRAPR